MLSRPIALLLATLVITGCGRTTIGAAKPATNSALAAKFSDDELSRYRGKVEKLVAYYDKNRDGAINPAESPVKYGTDRTLIDERFNRNWILRTEITYDLHRRVKSFMQMDPNDDGRATPKEINDVFLRDRDTNGDDKIGIWERVKAVFQTPSARFETKWYTETGRRQFFVWSPLRDVDRPAPPYATEAEPPMPEGRSQPPLKVELPEE